MGIMATVVKKKFPENEVIPGIISLVVIVAAIVLGIWAPRVYVVYEEDGEMTYYTNVAFFPYTYETEDGEEIEVEPVGFGCSVLNLTDSELYLYPECYGDCSGNYGETYTIYANSFEATEEWNIDYFPGDDIPDEVSSKSSTVINYVLTDY